MRVGSLFAGIGGFDLGLERAGFTIGWQCEIDPYCQRVLAKHWPAVTRYSDITTTDWHAVRAVDLICGGFPCQPFSTASHGKRTASSLWPAMLAVVGIVKPTWVLVENVAGAANLVFHQVAADLESLGYEVAPPLEIPACAVGLDHWRPRYWLLAYSNSGRQSSSSEHAEASQLQGGRSQFSSMGGPHGVPRELDRLRALGNAIVPQIAEHIGRSILHAQQELPGR